MNQKKTIFYKTKTNIIDELLKQGIVEEEKQKTFFSKLFSPKKNYPDIYMHTGNIDGEALDYIKNSKLIVVNSQSSKHKILLHGNIDSNKIHVIYPSIDLIYKKTKELKESISNDLNLDKKKKIILFTAKNFKTAGIKEFIQIIVSLQNDNYQVIIAGDKKQITNLKFQMSNLSLAEHIFLVEDYHNLDDLFLISDIFILPTYNQTFATNVLKAMFCKCAVFIPNSNHASELIDIFATMDDPDDRSTAFKVDALLLGMDDLRLIRKQNRKIAQEYTLEKNLSKLTELISKI